MRRLDDIVSLHDLNEHPFYLAWRAGTLPREALAVYAMDYAPFIGAVEKGWRTLGDVNHAVIEREHGRLWDDFRAGLGGPELPIHGGHQAQFLAAYAQRAFADPVTAIGALYAFEAQQPRTARSKLDGLVQHYALPEAATAYFRAHADDYGEKDQLSLRAAALRPDELLCAEDACERTCRAMWGALDGVMGVMGVMGVGECSKPQA
jgi:pyrroloquinoline-quinone synthase